MYEVQNLLRVQIINRVVLVTDVRGITLNEAPGNRVVLATDVQDVTLNELPMCSDASDKESVESSATGVGFSVDPVLFGLVTCVN